MILNEGFAWNLERYIILFEIIIRAARTRYIVIGVIVCEIRMEVITWAWLKIKPRMRSNGLQFPN